MAPHSGDPVDPYAPLKDRAWREVAEIDARLERGDLDEAGWHREVAALLVPAYLAADTPWGGSGKSGTLEDWDYSRSLICDAIDRDGSFLDVGCANGFLMESIGRWTDADLDLFGLDISPELADRARTRLPRFSDRIFVGNALTWEPPSAFTYIRTGLDYVPKRQQRNLVEHLLASCERLIVGVYNEQIHERPIEDLLRSWGIEIAGRTERAHRDPRMAYRCLWIDA